MVFFKHHCYFLIYNKWLITPPVSLPFFLHLSYFHLLKIYTILGNQADVPHKTERHLEKNEEKKKNPNPRINTFLLLNMEEREIASFLEWHSGEMVSNVT